MPEVLMPKLSDTMEEGTVLNWLQVEGAAVRRGDVIAEIASDKATFPLEAEWEGTLHILARRGSSIPIGGVIGQVCQVGEQIIEEAPVVGLEGGPHSASLEAVSVSRSVGAAHRRGTRVSPRARSLARQLGVDASVLVGRGPKGLVVSEDVLAAAPAQREGESSSVAADVPSRMELAIARRMMESAATVPQFVVNVSVEMDSVLSRLQVWNTQGHPVHATVTDLVLRGAALVLPRHPRLLRSWQNEKFVPADGVHLAVAVALPNGLVAPVVRDADRIPLEQLAGVVADLVGRARGGSLSEAELGGAVVTVSNLGPLGADGFVALVTPPQSCVLAIGAVRPTPVVRDERVGLRMVMQVNMSCDHRVVYGADAAEFLADLRSSLEGGGEIFD